MTRLALKILAVLLALPTYAEDRDRPEEKREQLRAVAQAIADASESRAEAALLIASGWEETGWSLRVHEGRCRPNECDHGQARGPWQLHRDGMPQETWDQMAGLENTATQARTAAKRIQWYRVSCGDTTGAIARYFGLPCSNRTERVWHRFRTYRRILDALHN